jgi:hypothetical protein
MSFWHNASFATYLQSRTNKHHKSALFGNQFSDFKAIFSNLFKGFWSKGLRVIFPKKKKRKRKDLSFVFEERKLIFLCLQLPLSYCIFFVNSNRSSITNKAYQSFDKEIK